MGEEPSKMVRARSCVETKCLTLQPWEYWRSFRETWQGGNKHHSSADREQADPARLFRHGKEHWRGEKRTGATAWVRISKSKSKSSSRRAVPEETPVEDWIDRHIPLRHCMKPCWSPTKFPSHSQRYL